MIIKVTMELDVDEAEWVRVTECVPDAVETTIRRWALRTLSQSNPVLCRGLRSVRLLRRD